MKKWLTTQETAEYLGIEVNMLRDLRRLKKGPPYVRMGHRTLRYMTTEVDAWIAQQRVEPTQ